MGRAWPAWRFRHGSLPRIASRLHAGQLRAGVEHGAGGLDGRQEGEGVAGRQGEPRGHPHPGGEGRLELGPVDEPGRQALRPDGRALGPQHGGQLDPFAQLEHGPGPDVEDVPQPPVEHQLLGQPQVAEAAGGGADHPDADGVVPRQVQPAQHAAHQPPALDPQVEPRRQRVGQLVDSLAPEAGGGGLRRAEGTGARGRRPDAGGSPLDFHPLARAEGPADEGHPEHPFRSIDVQAPRHGQRQRAVQQAEAGGDVVAGGGGRVLHATGRRLAGGRAGPLQGRVLVDHQPPQRQQEPRRRAEPDAAAQPDGDGGHERQVAQVGRDRVVPGGLAAVRAPATSAPAG